MDKAKTKLGVIFVLTIIAILISGIVIAQSVNSNNVYLVKSHKSDLKAKHDVRHNFDVGFTTKLNAKQVKNLQRQGIEVETVPLYHITKPPGGCDPWPQCKNGNGDSGISISWINPKDADTVSGTITIQIDASDDGSISSVEWRIDSESYTTATFNSETGYYEDSWDTTVYSDGDHSLTAKATDNDANTKEASIKVKVSNGGDGETRAGPSDQTPWGIEKVYNDKTITSTSGGLGIDVAVLDTGVYKEHLDLAARIAQCVDFTGGGPPGTVRIKEGSCDDKNGHGTHVAGTIAADAGSDGLGIYGVASQADIFAYKVCGSGGCWTDDIAAAIDYAGSHGAEIVSMSLGGDSQSSLIRDAIARNSNVLFVAAAGNDGPSLGSIDYPGANVNVIAAGAIDINENVPDWSSRGVNDGDFVIEEREVEFGAPGVSVESTWNDGSYNTISGTSMATPHVSGLAAKLWQGNAADTRTFLQDRAKLHDLDATGDDPATGFGLPTVG